VRQCGKCEFYSDRTLYRDIRRKLELWIDPAVLHQVWDATWNRWKHLLGAKMEIKRNFRKEREVSPAQGQMGTGHMGNALPSRLEIKLPSDFVQQVEAAKRTYHRFGQYSPSLDKIRSLVERKPMEKPAIERMLAAMKTSSASLKMPVSSQSFTWVRLRQRENRDSPIEVV